MANETLSLKASTRKEKRKQVAKLRKQGKIPAVLYGHKVNPESLTVDYSVFEKLFKQAGESTLVDLIVDEKKPVKVLIQDYQLDPITNQISHIDFYQIKMDEKLHAVVELKFINEAPAVKESNGILVTNTDSLEIECLPQDLVHEIEIDLSCLEKFDDAIHVKDIKMPEGITVLNVPDDVVILVQAPRTEKELEELEEKPVEEIPEGAEEEGEELAEGDEKHGEEEKPVEGEGKSEEEKK